MFAGRSERIVAGLEYSVDVGGILRQGLDDAARLPQEYARVPEKFARAYEGLSQFQVGLLGECFHLVEIGADRLAYLDISVACFGPGR